MTAETTGQAVNLGNPSPSLSDRIHAAKVAVFQVGMLANQMKLRQPYAEEIHGFELDALRALSQLEQHAAKALLLERHELEQSSQTS